ncbi:MAG: MBL fold metallo-hydrolase [bacterium]
MKALKFIGIIGLVFILSVNYYASDKNNKKINQGSKTVSKLLKHIVHISNNDIRFCTEKGICVFIDPVSWPTDDLVIRSKMIKPDLILITHSHEDHFQPTIIQEYLRLNPKTILCGPHDVVERLKIKGINAIEVSSNNIYTMAGIKFNTAPAYFTLEDAGHPLANHWVGYILQLDGTNYYVTGDTQSFPEMAEFKVDVIFPLLFGCGGNLEDAVKMAEITCAKLVVPVHTDGQEQSIKNYLNRLPKGVKGAYYIDTKLIF